MSAGTVLQIAQDVADELGLVRPASLFAAYNEGDTTDLKLRRALIKAGRFIHRYWNWPDTTGEVNFTSGTNGVQIGALPADFARLVKGSMYGLSPLVRIQQAEKPPVVAAGSTMQRQPVAVIRAGQLELYSSSVIGPITFQYVKNRTTVDLTNPASPIYKPDPTSDADFSLWDDEVLHLGMVWAVLHREGHTNNEDYQAFVGALHERMTSESTGEPLDFGQSEIDDTPRYPTTVWDA
jgi:hypothetical protein